MGSYTIKIEGYVNVPPSIVGDVDFTVRVGETLILKPENFLNSVPNYYHSYEGPPYSVYIEGPLEGDRIPLLVTTNPPGTIGYFMDDTTRIGYPSTSPNVAMSHNQLAGQNLMNNKAKLIGVAPGRSSVLYSITAWDGTNPASESDRSRLFGTINVTVVSLNNQPPSNVGPGQTTCRQGQQISVNRAFLSQNYSDPENDPPHLFRVDSLPTHGILLYMGVLVQVGQIIPFSDIDLGLLIYRNNPGTPVGTMEGFQGSIADSGSLTFTS